MDLWTRESALPGREPACILRHRMKPTRAQPTVTDPALVIVYTDGACIGNPGPGGYGIVILQRGERRELSSGFRHTTNNRMEMLAAVVALESFAARERVLLHSDSRYVVDAIEKGWARKWRANRWMRNAREPAINPDLWERMLTVVDLQDVRFQWVRGHAGNPENERCDVLATSAARRGGWPADESYEGGSIPRNNQRDMFGG
jgi:ribonuclease HI